MPKLNSSNKKKIISMNHEYRTYKLVAHLFEMFAYNIEVLLKGTSM